MKKFASISLVLVLVFAFVTVAGATADDPETFVRVVLSDHNTLDPAFSYDTGSGEIILNVYENLIKYKGTSTSEFEPLLATEVPSTENGLISDDGLTYTFPIRKDVKFHNGNELTPEDVEYTFERVLIFDRDGGPAWMLLEPLLGVSSIKSLATEIAGVEKFENVTEEDMLKVYEKVDEAIEVEGNKVVFKLAKPYAPFMQIVSHFSSWSSILNKEWAMEQGAWDGKASTWSEYNNPQKEEDPLFEVMNGTGPYKFVEWEKNNKVVLQRNENYWGEVPPIETVVVKSVSEWSTRRIMLENGDADSIQASMQYLSQIQKMNNIKFDTYPTLQMTTVFFNQNIATKGNKFVGSGKLDGEGISSDFFSDVDVRKAFSYGFSYKPFIEEVFEGKAIKPTSAIPKGLLGFNPDQPTYNHDMDKAEEHLKKAWDGKLWKNGFEFTVLYNEGNAQRKTAMEILKFNIESLNPKFKINVHAVQWGNYLDSLIQGKLTAFALGWLPDYPDPHNFVVPFYASDGTYGSYLGENYKEWAKENVDPLIEKALASTNNEKRTEIYNELQMNAYNDAALLPIAQPEAIRLLGDHVEGFYYHPMRSGPQYSKLKIEM